eukprot:362796-Chlamydomonas_euryale.AAC.4
MCNQQWQQLLLLLGQVLAQRGVNLLDLADQAAHRFRARAWVAALRECRGQQLRQLLEQALLISVLKAVGERHVLHLGVERWVHHLPQCACMHACEHAWT